MHNMRKIFLKTRCYCIRLNNTNDQAINWLLDIYQQEKILSTNQQKLWANVYVSYLTNYQSYNLKATTFDSSNKRPHKI